MKKRLHSKEEVKKPARKKTISSSLAAPKKAKRAATSDVQTVTSSTVKRAPRGRSLLKEPSVTVKKTLAVKGVTKNRSRSKTLPQQKVVPVTQSGVVMAPETVFVPSTASLRLLEKVALYRLWYKNNFPNEVARMARVTGYVFVLVGTFLAAATYVFDTNSEVLPAAAVCTTLGCVEVDDAQLPPSAPKITYLNSLPAVLEADTDIILRSETEHQPKLYLREIQSGEITILSTAEVRTNNEFRYLLEVAKLKPGFYETLAELSALDAVYKFRGPTFMVEGSARIPMYDEVAPLTTFVDTVSHATGSIDEAGVGSEEDVERVADADVVVQTKPSLNSLTEGRPVHISLTTAATNIFLTIKTGEYIPDSVAVYAKTSTGGTSLFLGAATQVHGEWIFSLSALPLPSVPLEFFAMFTSQGRSYQTDTLTYRPTEFINPALTTPDEIALLESKITLALETADVQNATRKQYYSYIASSSPTFFDQAHEGTFASTMDSSRADLLLSEHTERINQLLFAYALFAQTETPYLLQYQSLVIRDAYQAFMVAMGQSKNSVFETILSLRFEALRNRVAEMEDRVREDVAGLTASDVDGDGISDYDELANIGTDPAKADTDNDSVLDAIEVAEGADPTRALLLDFPNTKYSIQSSSESPLKIDTVTGLASVENGITRVYPVLRGSAIPLSYVYILFPESGKTGIVKTNTEGTFSYTLEEALDDGTYTAYVALIDANGNFVTTSNPVTFTKKDEQLLATALFSEIIQIDSVSNSNVPYVVAAAIAVVVFGFVLVLLAESLFVQSRRQKISTTNQ